MDILLVFVLILLYTFQNFFCKLFSLASKAPKTTSPVYTSIFGSVIGIVTLFLYKFQFQASPATWLFGLLNALVLFGFTTSLVNASERGSYAFVNVCSPFGGILIPLVVSVALWDDRFTPLQIIAIILMLVSFVVINCKGLSLKGSKGAYYLFCVLLFLTNGLYGVVLDAQQRVLQKQERGEMIIITYLGTALLSVLFIAAKHRKDFIPSFRIGTKALLCGIGSGIAAVSAVNLLMIMMERVQPAILFTMNNGGVLFCSTVLSAFVLKEKIEKHQIPGYLMALLSIVLLSL